MTLATVLVAVFISAPAGYVLSRSRSKAISGYALLLFVVQSFPQIVSIVPLFVLFAKFNLDDNLLGLAIVYVSMTVSVATWMMAAYFDTIPVALEEASWIDGCSLFGGFVRIVLRNSLPGVLSTAIFAFLLAWSDFLVAVVFLHSDTNFTLPIGLQTFFTANNTEWGYVMALSVIVIVPPVIVFSFLTATSASEGIGGSLRVAIELPGLARWCLDGALSLPEASSGLAGEVEVMIVTANGMAPVTAPRLSPEWGTVPGQRAGHGLASVVGVLPRGGAESRRLKVLAGVF